MDLKLCDRQGKAWSSRAEEIAAAILFHRSYNGGSRVSFNGEQVLGVDYRSAKDKTVLMLESGREIVAGKDFDFSPVVFHPPEDMTSHDLHHYFLMSVQFGHHDIVKMLLSEDNGFAIDLNWNNGDFVGWAAFCNNTAIAETLIKSGASIKRNGERLVRFAMQNGSSEMLSILMRYGVDDVPDYHPLVLECNVTDMTSPNRVDYSSQPALSVNANS